MFYYPFQEVVAFLVVHNQLLLIMPMVMAFFVEEHYISRVSIVSNTAGMFVAVAPRWGETRSWLMFMGFPIFHIYLLVGLVFAVIAFLGYTTDQSQPSEFYWVCWAFFNSAISGFVCFIMAMNYPTG